MPPLDKIAFLTNASLRDMHTISYNALSEMAILHARGYISRTCIEEVSEVLRRLEIEIEKRGLDITGSIYGQN